MVKKKKRKKKETKSKNTWTTYAELEELLCEGI